MRSSGVPGIELRASLVIGCVSASFEIIHAVVERLQASAVLIFDIGG